MAMLTEKEIRLRAIRWRLIALLGEYDGKESSNVPFAKSNAYVDVLNLPHDIQCGKKSRDGLSLYCEGLLASYLLVRNENLPILEWMTDNVKYDFENHI